MINGHRNTNSYRNRAPNKLDIIARVEHTFPTLTHSLCVCLYHSQLMIWCCSGGYVSLFADCIIIFSTYLRTLHSQLHHHITDHNHSVNFCPSLFFAPHFRPLSILAAIQCLIILTFAKSFDHLNQYASVVLSFTSFLFGSSGFKIYMSKGIQRHQSKYAHSLEWCGTAVGNWWWNDGKKRCPEKQREKTHYARELWPVEKVRRNLVTLATLSVFTISFSVVDNNVVIMSLQFKLTQWN